MKFKLGIGVVILWLLFFVPVSALSASTDTTVFEGKGTFDEPYIISDKEDLLELQKCTNEGNDFFGKYFIQTEDIDLCDVSWIPIGSSYTNSFAGIYNGNGNSIYNLTVENINGSAGFFGYLEGKVVNLSIESGNIFGYECGSFAVRAVGSQAVIANCVNKASLKGTRVGGIACDFYDGVLANCINFGKIEGEYAYSITAGNGDVKIYSCYAKVGPLAPNNIVVAESAIVSTDYISSNKFAIKFSLTAAISRWLFLGDTHTELMEWKSATEPLYSDSKHITIIINFVNFFLLPSILVVMLLVYYFLYKKDDIRFKQVYKKDILAFSIVFGIISIFIDTALVSKGFSVLSFGNTVFIVLCNFIFAICSVCYHKWYPLKKIEVPISLVVLIIVSVLIEVFQFDNIPRYDANIYYGSMIKAVDMFNLDLLSFIGAFNCWKWAQGLCLIIAPFEFLFHRQVIGIYIANVIITVVTIFILFWILRRIYPNMKKHIATLYCAIFVFSPYIIGLFSYLDMDWHIAFFSIWLIAAVIEDNDVLISFVGFLLCFTKITGLAFYVAFLIVYSIVNVINQKGSIKENLRNWCCPKRVFLWILPTLMFLFLLIYGNYLTTQSFFGTYVSDSMIKLNDFNQISNTILHTFVFGFRWLFSLLTLIGLVVLLAKRKDVCGGINKQIVISLYVAFSFVFILLCIYNADANCPRYTTIFSSLYILILPFCFECILQGAKVKTIVLLVMSGICFIQTFWTIDPIIIKYADSIDTGVKKIYKLAYKNDTRPGMNLCSGVAKQYPIMGDIYAYNLEYSYYDDLLDEAFGNIDFDETKKIYVLDIILYELNINGNNYGAGETYKIYWDSESKKRTFENEGNTRLNVSELYSQNILEAPENGIFLESEFYLIVPKRVDSSEVENKLLELGYVQIENSEVKNMYGALKLYYYSK